MFVEVSCPVQNIGAFALGISFGQTHVHGNMAQVNKKTTVVPEGCLLQWRALWLDQARGTSANCNNHNWECLVYVLNYSEISNQQDKPGCIGKDGSC